VNPETGKVEKYEECWVDLDLQGGESGIGAQDGGWREGE
jgi:hypothetical protein